MDTQNKIQLLIFIFLCMHQSCSSSSIRSRRLIGLNSGVILMQSHTKSSQTINNYNHPPYGLYIALGFVYMLSIFFVIVEACYCKCFDARDFCWILLVVIFIPFVSFIVCPIVKKCANCQM